MTKICSQSLVEGERRDEQEMEDRKILGLDELVLLWNIMRTYLLENVLISSDRKWHTMDPKHFVEENKRPLVRILYNELKVANAPQHWVRTCLKTLFVPKVYRRLFMKEQKRYKIRTT